MATILLAEDNMLIRNIYAKLIEHAGHEVFQAADGQEINDFFNDPQKQIDLLIIDREFEKADDGIPICRELRKQGKTFPIILCSAHPVTDKIVQEALRTGILNDALGKPLNYPELVKAIDALIQQP